ncbi:hypothetical protein, partial [Plasmodium yoelii yoelii]
MLSNPYSCS